MICGLGFGIQNDLRYKINDDHKGNVQNKWSNIWGSNLHG